MENNEEITNKREFGESRLKGFMAQYVRFALAGEDETKQWEDIENILDSVMLDSEKIKIIEGLMKRRKRISLEKARKRLKD